MRITRPRWGRGSKLYFTCYVLRGVSVGVLRVRIRPCGQQLEDDARLAHGGGCVQRGVPSEVPVGGSAQGKEGEGGRSSFHVCRCACVWGGGGGVRGQDCSGDWRPMSCARGERCRVMASRGPKAGSTTVCPLGSCSPRSRPGASPSGVCVSVCVCFVCIDLEFCFLQRVRQRRS
jgi:hypothetical protein